MRISITPLALGTANCKLLAAWPQHCSSLAAALKPYACMRTSVPIHHQLTPTSMSMYHVVHALIRVMSDDACRPLHVLHMQTVLMYPAFDHTCRLC